MINASKKLDISDAKTADQILFLVKTRGAVSTAVLAQSLGLTVEAARQQVQRLVTDGLLEGRKEAASGLGRPGNRWVLSAAGFTRFPDTHAQLTVQLLTAVKAVFGDSGIDQLIAQRERETKAVYRETFERIPTLKAKVEKLALMRDAEGYMARVEKDGKDLLLVEDHCPICAAAQTCQGFCRSELDLFKYAMGSKAVVVREEHLFEGARRCVYRIKPV
jgi:predicted ArsR family transcriptional regulator